MIKIPNKLIKKLKYYLTIFDRKRKTAGMLNLMAQNTDRHFKKVISSFSFFYENKSWLETEREALKKVDKMRDGYKKSTEKILVEDYGAGNSNDVRTKVEMIKGVAEYQMVSDIYKECSNPDKWGLLIFKLIRN